MHSSRVHTIRPLKYRGGGLCPHRDPPGQRPSGQRHPWTETPRDRDPLPVDIQTSVKRLPSQTSFASGKNAHTCTCILPEQIGAILDVQCNTVVRLVSSYLLHKQPQIAIRQFNLA